MYKKRKKINKELYDRNLESYCKDLLMVNDDVLFCVSKRFIENENKSGFKEIENNNIKVIVSSIEPEKLNIPSSYKLVVKDFEYYLTTWCDIKKPLAKIIYRNFIFTDGDINNKKIKNLNLEIK